MLHGMRLWPFALALVGCAPSSPAASPSHAESDRRALFAVDRAFSARSVEKGSDVAFTEYAADDATMLPMGGAPLVGKAAIVKSFAESPWDGKSELRWEPAFADASGDLGYTWGTFVAARDKDGKRIEKRGKYVSVWKRQSDGSWKWVVDVGNMGPD
jgi:ketosteroid isomerase-like protein